MRTMEVHWQIVVCGSRVDDRREKKQPATTTPITRTQYTIKSVPEKEKEKLILVQRHTNTVTPHSLQFIERNVYHVRCN